MSLYQGESDELVSCPFNPSHKFFKSVLQKHIIKCSRNYPDHFTCPYNALHRFLVKEYFEKHIVVCPDASYWIDKQHAKPTQHGDLRPTPLHDENTQQFNLEHENWDAEYK